MAQLPADRTKLALAQGNQSPTLVAASAKNINAITELYDTTDLLNAKVDTLTANGTVTTNKIAPSAVTTEKIAPLAVTTDKIANEAVTADKIDPALFVPDVTLNAHKTYSVLDHPDGSVTDPKLSRDVRIKRIYKVVW